MDLKKLSVSALTLSLSAALLAGCSGKPAETPVPAGDPSDLVAVESKGAVKTGLSIQASVSGSREATAEANGKASANIALTAVTVDDEGVIYACAIDVIDTQVEFDAAGKIVSELGDVLSKNELGDDYGMRKASSINAEWNEQAAAFAEYAVGKTVEELKGIAVDESGKAAGADLASSVTLAVGEFIPGIEAAVNNAAHMGAQAGDKLSLTHSTSLSKSRDAGEKDGVAETYAHMAAITSNGDTITSCYIDALQADVNFDTTGRITSDITLPVATKNELGEGYGMKGISSIGKEWNEQAAAFAEYVTGKTFADVAGIAVEGGKAADADLAASVTIGIGDFQDMIAKAQ